MTSITDELAAAGAQINAPDDPKVIKTIIFIDSDFFSIGFLTIYLWSDGSITVDYPWEIDGLAWLGAFKLPPIPPVPPNLIPPRPRPGFNVIKDSKSNVERRAGKAIAVYLIKEWIHDRIANLWDWVKAGWEWIKKALAAGEFRQGTFASGVLIGIAQGFSRLFELAGLNVAGELARHGHDPRLFGPESPGTLRTSLSGIGTTLSGIAQPGGSLRLGAPMPILNSMQTVLTHEAVGDLPENWRG